MDLDPGKLEVYLEGVRRRRAAREAAQAERRARALALAREDARFFDEHSDLDLAVWDLDERLYFRAQGQVLALDPDISIDLVRYEDASPALREEIDRHGIDI